MLARLHPLVPIWPLAVMCLPLTGCGTSAVHTAGPETTLKRYAEAIRAGDVQTAHGLLSEDIQAGTSAEELAALVDDNRAELGDQVDHLERLAGDGIRAEARMPLATGETVVLVLEEGSWVVDGGVLDAPALRTPGDAVRALRRALARRSMSGLLRVLARRPRAELESDIAELLEETEDDLDMEVEVRGNDARVRTTGGRDIRLIRESGEWRVIEIE